jgi:hypothetical protein
LHDQTGGVRPLQSEVDARGGSVLAHIAQAFLNDAEDRKFNRLWQSP